jgi:hypothetical protein
MSRYGKAVLLGILNYNTHIQTVGPTTFANSTHKDSGMVQSILLNLVLDTARLLFLNHLF